MKEPKLPGNLPRISLDQYREIIKLKKSKDRIAEMTYAFLAKELGLRPSAVVNAARRGIKRYDYILAKERQEK